MTIVHPPSTERDTNAIEHLDFAPPCHRKSCESGQPAAWLVWITDRPCGCPRLADVVCFCRPCWTSLTSGATRCMVCGHVYLFMVRVLRVERI